MNERKIEKCKKKEGKRERNMKEGNRETKKKKERDKESG